MKDYKTTYKDKNTGEIKPLTINSSILSLIRHNAYLKKKYNTFKNDIVSPTITKVSDYKNLISEGKTKREIYSTIVKEKNALEIPESLTKLQRQINQQKRKDKREERVKSGGVYTQYKNEGLKETKRILKANLNRVQGFANPLHVKALIDHLNETHDVYNLLNASINGNSAFTSEQEKDFIANLNKIKRHVNKFPDKLIPIINDFSYQLANGTIDPTEFNAGVYMYLQINNIN